MKKQIKITYKVLLYLLICLPVQGSIAQNELREPLVDDSLILKHRIQQVTENWFHNSLQESPANTTTELYNEAGQRTQRIYINYTYHKFVDHFEYNEKKHVIIQKQHYHDWNPHREKRKGDTLVKKKVFTYDLSSKRNVKAKNGSLDTFEPILTFDRMARITTRKDTVKCGYNITHYSYDKNNRVVERIHYTTRHDEPPKLVSIDSLQYNPEGRLVKEINYHSPSTSENNRSFDREVITIFRYFPNGLLEEKTIQKIYNTQTDAGLISSVYKYSYTFY